MDLGLEGEVALALGGSGGLGSAIGTMLAREGARVALGGRNADRIAAVVKAITAAGGEALPLTWDLTNAARTTLTPPLPSLQRRSSFRTIR